MSNRRRVRNLGGMRTPLHPDSGYELTADGLELRQMLVDLQAEGYTTEDVLRVYGPEMGLRINQLYEPFLKLSQNGVL